MTTPTQAEVLVMRAASASIGILVETSHGGVDRALSTLGKARTEHAPSNPEVARLVFRRNPHSPHTQLFIVKGPPPTATQNSGGGDAEKQ